MTILINDLSTVYEQLEQFAGSEDFWLKFDRVFGSEYNFSVAENIKTQWLNQDFSQLPTISIIDNNILGNARGGYAVSTNTIYLSDSFFANSSQSLITSVILEEIGHFIDAQINEIDTVGDEGELFSALVTGQSLSVEALNRISTENDFSTIVLNGDTLIIEQSTNTFSNTGSIEIPISTGVNVNNSPANPYPSSIVVSGFIGMVIDSVQVTLHNLSHAFPKDIDILLVNPTGVAMILMSDTGGTQAAPLSNVTLTFSDTASSFVPADSLVTSGTYKPTNNSPSDIFPSPAPSGAYFSTLVAFKGTEPNGTWSLYVVDDTQLDTGNMSGGWNITITTVPANQAPTDLSLSGDTITENVAIGAGVKIGDITITDPDATGNNNVLTVDDTTNFEIRNGTELFFIGASPDFETKSTYDIIITSTDDNGGNPVTYSEAFTVNVNDINESPTVANAIAPQTAKEENSFDFTFDINTFNDQDQGDTLSYNATLDDGNALPNWLSFNSNSRTFSGTPTLSDVTTTPINVKVTATDTGTLSVSNIFELTVSPLPINNVKGSGTANNLVGISDHKNNFNGGGGNDTLTGGDFADTLLGGSGNDILSGGDFADILDGGSGNDTLMGGDGNDILTAGSGNDFLIGGNGNDTLTGGSGMDFFFFNSPSEGIDTITDFKVVDDSIVLSGSGFSLNTGTLMANQFRSGAGVSSANSASQHLIYNTSNGALYYDADGVGGATETQIASLRGGLALTNNDFIVI